MAALITKTVHAMSFLVIAVFLQPPTFADFESVTLLVRDEKCSLCLLAERFAIKLVEPKSVRDQSHSNNSSIRLIGWARAGAVFPC